MKNLTVKERFEEIMEQIKTLNQEARNIVKEHASSFDVSRADAYWYSQINGIVDGRGSMVTMQTFLDDNEGEEFLDKVVEFENPLEDWYDDDSDD